MKCPPRLSAALLGIASCLVYLGLAGCGGPAQFLGTTLSSESPAAPFELRNQFGETVSMADRRGRVVVLTFLYTACPDICPLTAERLRTAYELLGEGEKDVSVLVISVDPERDTEKAALAYSKKWRMEGIWDYLVGDRTSLSETWRAYFVAASVEDGDGAVLATRPEGEAGKSGVEDLGQAIKERYLVSTRDPSTSSTGTGSCGCCSHYPSRPPTSPTTSRCCWSPTEGAGMGTCPPSYPPLR